MLNNILSAIGILLIVYSIYIIKKDIVDNKNKVEELLLIEKKTKQYYEYTDDIVSSFDKLVDLKLEKIDVNNYDVIEKQEDFHIESDDQTLEKSISNERNPKLENLSQENKKIIDLLDVGLTQEEIAKKLNKGVREIDIISKMYRKNL